MQNWGCDIISFDEMFKIIAFEKDNSNDSEYISQMTLFEEVIDEMIKQDIPCINAQSIFMGFLREPKKISEMLEWLKEHRNIPYGEMDLVNIKLKLVGVPKL